MPKLYKDKVFKNFRNFKLNAEKILATYLKKNLVQY